MLAQEGPAPEIVIVDDCSQVPVADVPGATVVRLAAQVGAAAARNRGVEWARTEWVAFLDDDDLWAPSKLRRQHAALQAQPEARWSYTGVVVTDARRAVTGVQRAHASGWIHETLCTANVVAGGGSTVLARTDLVREVNGFDSSVRSAEDWEMWTRLAQRSPVVAVDAPLAAWREHRGNKSQRWDATQIERTESVLRERAREIGAAFSHEHRAQLEIDRLVAAGARTDAARAYWSRFRRRRQPRDAVAALGVATAPATYAALKRRARRRAVPVEWLPELDWLASAPAEDDRAMGLRTDE